MSSFFQLTVDELCNFSDTIVVAQILDAINTRYPIYKSPYIIAEQIDPKVKKIENSYFTEKIKLCCDYVLKGNLEDNKVYIYNGIDHHFPIAYMLYGRSKTFKILYKLGVKKISGIFFLRKLPEINEYILAIRNPSCMFFQPGNTKKIITSKYFKEIKKKIEEYV